ncbi:serine hydrolase domain-containing protein [Duganella aceris]|uniref:Beta-lactamase family protein n=1 Tax=Duganella aceris TaxID=2703883 RepID=A0ABX0FH18_9BURK|nr:serine hydrolase domain-containing protein [Duganella aceris]NGZ83867.1 beta-lactamase family protein [Duganella aceris]
MRPIVAIFFAAVSQWAPAAIAATKAEVIDAELTRIFAPDMPGAAVLVVKDGVTVLNKGYGLANVELNVPVGPEQLFNVASVGKQFTAAAILKLAEDGKLTIQTPIRKFFPDVPPTWSGITVEHLLNHTSGIANIFMDEAFRRYAFEDHTPRQLMAQAVAMPLLAPPGDGYSYSSANYTLLAMIIEQLTGEQVDAYLARQFFAPLGMTHTHAIRDTTLIKGLATPYEKGPRLAVRWSATLLFGGGGFASNNADLLRWTMALQGGAVLNPASLAAMNTALTLTNGKRVPYGLGLRPHTLAGKPYLQSNGDIHGSHAEVVFLAASKIFVSILSNSEDALQYGLRPVAKRLATIAADMPRHDVRPMTLSESALRQLAGTYRHGADSYIFQLKDGRLQVEYSVNKRVARLQAISPTEFCYEGNSDFRFKFSTGPDGRQLTQWFEIDRLDDEVDPVFEKE